jgi:hypothetical protein
MPEPGALLVSVLVSLVGFAVFVYGRKQSRLPHLVAGVVLMVMPYFLPGFLIPAAATAAVLALLWLATRMGA